jgi:tetratricopeptide (TPR) repeat protein
MATKAKTAGTPSTASVPTLEGKFSEAIELVTTGKYDKAITMLDALLTEASAQGNLGMCRAIRGYQAAAKARLEDKAKASTDPLALAQFYLNRREPDAALDLIAKHLDKGQANGKLLYLRATAFAQKEDVEAAAEALRQSIQMDEAMLHQFRMEPDFDRIRHHASLASLNQA